MRYEKNERKIFRFSIIKKKNIIIHKFLKQIIRLKKKIRLIFIFFRTFFLHLMWIIYSKTYEDVFYYLLYNSV